MSIDLREIKSRLDLVFLNIYSFLGSINNEIDLFN